MVRICMCKFRDATITGRALFDYDGDREPRISFKKNEVLVITHEDDTGQWMKGQFQFVCAYICA